MENLNPEIWGPNFWFVIDTVLYSLPDKLNKQQQEDLEMFLYSLKSLLPCEKCRNHYIKAMEERNFSNINFSKKQDVITWMSDLRNIIKSHQKKRLYSIGSTKKYYDEIFRNTEFKDIFIIFIFICAVSLLIKRSLK